MKRYNELKEIDEEVRQCLIGEDIRQANNIELIPSENYISTAVMEALNSSMTNKYSEGYPGKRYYSGQRYTDAVENIAIERICKLFKCKYANVQPLSGSAANLATYSALLEPGDTVLGMNLSHGGHLTHGHPNSLSAKIYNFVNYKMSNIETGEIDYDELRRIALKEKPKIILAGFSAYPRNLDYKNFVKIAKEINAITVADISHIAGLIAGGALENPFDVGFDIITSTTHKTLRGPRGGIILIRENEELFKKINKAIFPGLQGGPHMNNIAAKAVSFKEAQSPNFKIYAERVLKNAKVFERVFEKNNVRMITGGTSNHLLLIDTITSFNLSGKEAETILDNVGITVNKNILPDDLRSSTDPSGIRLGTPAITTRNFNESTCEEVAQLIVDALRKIKDETYIQKRVAAISVMHTIPERFN